MGNPSPEPRWRAPLHTFVLSSFAVAQPLLGTLGENPTFFAAHGLGRLELVVFVLCLLIIPPAVMLAIIALVRLVSRPAARVVELVVIGGLVALALGPALAKTLGTTVALVIYLVLGVVAAIVYARVPIVRRFVTFLVIGPIVMIVLFFGPTSRSAVFTRVPETPRAATTHEDPPSVVFVLLDEFALGTITDRDGDIDAERFPNFARLAEGSTWYRNATTNANITSDAFPSLMTGRYPPKGNELPPIHAIYPHNLFTLLDQTHDLRAAENISALCPARMCPERLQAWGSPKHLAADTALIYAHLALPPSIAHRLPEFGVQWGGFLASPLASPERIEEFPAPARPVVGPVLSWLASDELRSSETDRFDAFIDTVAPADDPTLWFVHTMLPHSPWHVLHDARAYDFIVNPGWVGGRWITSVGADSAFQRYVLQAQATDRLIGTLIDRMERADIWDDTMVIVQADHGALFKEGFEHRSVRGSPVDLTRIPLFIKYPGQRKGRVDTGVAELIDVVPTIADVLGMELPWKADGTSLADADRRTRPRRVWEWARRLDALDLDVDDFGYGAARITKLFGRDGGRDDIYAWGPHRELVGKRARAATGDGTATIDRHERYRDVEPDDAFAPARVSGRITRGSWEWVAVSVNGRIAGLGQPYQEGGGLRFAVMVSPRFLRAGANDIAVYGVERDGDTVRIGPR